MQPEDDVLCHCSGTIFPTFRILQKMAQAISSAVVLEIVFGDVVQGQQSAQGRALVFLQTLCPQHCLRPGSKEGVRVPRLGTAIPLTLLIASRDRLGVLG